MARSSSPQEPESGASVTIKTIAAAKKAPKKSATAKVAKKAAPVKKSATKASGKKSATKSTAKKATKKAAPVKKSATKTAAKKSPAKKVTAKKVTSEKVTAKKVTSEKAPAAKKQTKKPSAAKSAPKTTTPPKKAPVVKKAPDKFMLQQRDLLLKEREEHSEQFEAFKAEADQLAREMEPGDSDFGEEGGEGGTLSIDRERDLAMSARVRDVIDLIDDALVKIDNGVYGACESCGKPIVKDRLRALPYATLCINCKQGGLRAR